MEEDRKDGGTDYLYAVGYMLWVYIQGWHETPFSWDHREMLGRSQRELGMLPPCSSRSRLVFAEDHLQYSETHGLAVDLTSRYPGQNCTVPDFYAPDVANRFRDQDYGRSVLLRCVGGLVNAFVLLAFQ
jgi:hypothetical protein